MEEGEALVGLGLFFELLRGEAQGLLDEGVNEVVEDAEALAEGLAGDEAVGGSGAGDEGLDSLDFGEGVGEERLGRYERFDRLA